mmetsp:Transcript_26154/g.66750  ORF Transcript_26154/g.66750 Transcript_26154/m.66750 type:complete len:293 (+) Transcript_26154:700-1578(+)
MPAAPFSPDTTTKFASKDGRVLIPLQIELDVVASERNIQAEHIRCAQVSLDLPPLFRVHVHGDEHAERRLLHAEPQVHQVFHEPFFLCLLRLIFQHLQLLDKNLIEICLLGLILGLLMRMAICRRHKLTVLVHDHGCPLHVFVPLHVRPVGLPLVSHQATPQLPRCLLHNLNRDEPVSTTMLSHCPVALLTIHLLVRWSVQTTYHVPRGAASSLAHLNAAFRELDHHVIRCQVLNTFAAVPIAGDLVDLPTATTTLIRWSQLDGDAIAVCGLVSIAMAELLWRSEDVMRLHA